MKYDGILLCSDFDGTLVGDSKCVSEENRQAIQMFQANGGMFTMATGRTPLYIADVMKDIIPNAPMIAVNGSIIYDHINKCELARIPLCDNREPIPEIYNTPQCIGCNLIRTDYENVMLRKSEGHNIDHLLKQMYSPLLKVVFIFDDTKTPIELSEAFNAQYGDLFTFSRSWAESLEMLDKHATKGAMVKRLKSLLPQVHTTIGVGDFENDLTLLSDADIGYAVENAIPAVKAVSDRMTVGCDQNAIARIIYEL